MIESSSLPGGRPPIRWAQALPHAATIVLAAAPLLALLVRFGTRGFGPEPVEDITHVSGEWALRLILLSLAITPARRLLGWRGIAPLRRTLGLAGFAYACLHLTTWLALDHAFDVPAILEDLSERPYVMAGMASFALLALLAATSTRSSMKRLGVRWTRLHRLVYPAAILAVLHHFWLLKADLAPAIVHGQCWPCSWA